MPQTAWEAYQGYLSTVETDGSISGESLPTRIAQTAWILYQNSSNSTYLTNAYSDIKDHLLWCQDNLRWFYSGHNIEEERDLEFVASYMADVEFAIKIADELNITSDLTLWSNEKAAVEAELDDWFFKDSDVIYGLYYEYTEIPEVWAIGNDNFKASGIVIGDDLTSTQMTQMKNWYMSIHRPDYPLNNMAYHKFPDASLIIDGLIENSGHEQAEEYAKACLRDTIRAKEMGEAIIATGSGYSTGDVKIESVVPSLFTAVEAIHMTWMLNGLRYDHDTQTSFSFGTSSLTEPNSTDILPTIEDFNDISEWTNNYNSYMSAVGGSAVIRYSNITSSTYGFVEKEVTYDVDKYPILTITVDEVYGNAQWALKVNRTGTDIQLQGDTSNVGEISYNLKEITGWSGTQTFKMRLYIMDKDIKVSDISVETIGENFNVVTDWTCPENSTISTDTGIGRVTTTSSYGYAKKSVEYNVDEFEEITIKVDSLSSGAQWALKVDDGSGDITLQSDSSSTGTFTYDLKSLTSWSGVKSFDIKLFAIGGNGKYVDVDYITVPYDAVAIEDFDAVADWTCPENSTISATNGIGKITTTAAYGYAKKSVTCNVDTYERIKIDISTLSSSGQWALKVNDGGTDITIQYDSSSTGELVYDLKAITGWSGIKTFDIKLFAVGGSGEYVEVEEIKVIDT